MVCPFDRADCDWLTSKDAKVVDCLACALTFAQFDGDSIADEQRRHRYRANRAIVSSRQLDSD